MGNALREAQGVNTLILNSSHDCIIVLDLDGRTQFVSLGGIEAMETPDADAGLGLSWLRMWQGADQEVAAMTPSEARAGGIGGFQGFCPTRKICQKVGCDDFAAARLGRAACRGS